MVVVILGPTASGKTELALALARRWPVEIVNADSRQVYRGLDVGTAKPLPQERASVPHHLYDIVDPCDTFSAADFARLADEAISAIRQRGRLPLVVGGTGLYLRALLQGLFEGPARSDYHDRLERVASRRGLGTLRRWLERVDPEWARMVAPRDRQRILRGLDVYLQTKVPISRHLERSAPGCRHENLKLGIAWERDELYRRINQRVERMFEDGFEAEVRRLSALSRFRQSNAARSVGYRELVAAAGAGDRREVMEQIRRSTRRLAKRQLTWFRRESDVHWLEVRDGRLPVREAEDQVEQWLEQTGAREDAVCSWQMRGLAVHAKKEGSRNDDQGAEL